MLVLVKRLKDYHSPLTCPPASQTISVRAELETAESSLSATWLQIDFFVCPPIQLRRLSLKQSIEDSIPLYISLLIDTATPIVCCALHFLPNSALNAYYTDLKFFAPSDRTTCSVNLVELNLKNSRHKWDSRARDAAFPSPLHRTSITFWNK